MIRPDLLNLLIVWAMLIVIRFISNVLAALTHDTPVGQALSIVSA
jgi:hypothetical protein